MNDQKTAVSIAPIIVLPTDTHPEEVSFIRGAGYIPVLCDDPSKVRVILPAASVAADDLLMSALAGLCSQYASESSKSAMVVELHKRLLSKESEMKGSTS